MRKNIFALCALSLLSVSCIEFEKGELGEKLIYMPQASMFNGGITHEYPVPMEGLNIDNYTISEEGILDITLGVYRSGEGDFEAFNVKVAYDEPATLEAAGAIAGAVVIPDGTLTVPSEVAVKAGERQATFHVQVDMATIRENYPDYYKNKIVAAVTISDPSRYELNEDLCTTVISINGATFIEAPLLPDPPTLVNLVKCGDFEADVNTYWTIKNINGDAQESMKIVDGHLEVSRPGASDNNYRWVCYNKLDEPLVAGKWYKMQVKISVPTPVVWYARGIDLGFCVFGKDPAGLNDYKADKDCIFFVDTDMEAARQEVGPLHGTDGYVNFPTVCTYCNPGDLKTNGGLFQAVDGQQWVGFYLRVRNTLVDMNKVLFDDIVIAEVEEP